MIFNVVMLILSLSLILFACFIFTNAIEWFGKKLNFGQGVVGSVFSAIGTALPETLIPIIAILFAKGANSDEIGIGSIAGAPFMLSSLAFFVTGFAVLVYSALGIRKVKMNVHINVISRDLTFFIVIYSIAVLTTFIHTYIILKIIIAIVLLLSYVIYLKTTFNGDTNEVENVDELYFSKLFEVETSLVWIVVQLCLALVAIVLGSYLFVKHVEGISIILGMSPLILSIIITPIATELPEKLNSIIWIGKKKDTLALGNITGAMVFQSCVPVVFGIIFTPWNLTGITMLASVFALTSAIINLVWIKTRKTVNAYVLMLGGILYAIFILNIFN